MNHYFKNNCLYTDFTISNDNVGVIYESADRAPSSDESLLLRMYDKEIEQLKRRVGKDRSLSTLKKHESVRKHLQGFILWKTSEKDIPLSEIGEDFFVDFCAYLMEECHLSQSTAWIYSIPLKHLINTAFSRGIISRNPFVSHHVSPQVKERAFLSEQELKVVMETSLKGKLLNLARDLFVFSCWTGLSFIDIKNLERNSLVEHKGELWILSRRKKTNKPFQIKVLEPAREILKKYIKRKYKKGKVFRIGYSNYLNIKLKELMKVCGISKNISFHCARHTFATMALNNGMSLESVSQILGHSSIKTTQIYAKITLKKLDKDFSVFNDNVKDAFF